MTTYHCRPNLCDHPTGLYNKKKCKRCQRSQTLLNPPFYLFPFVTAYPIHHQTGCDLISRSIDMKLAGSAYSLALDIMT